MNRVDVPTPRPIESQPTLLERLRAGDEAGWGKFVRVYGQLVYCWCRPARLSPENAGDISQNVLVKLSKTSHSCLNRRPRDSFRSWLETVANNRARNFHRGQRGRQQARVDTTAQLQIASYPGGDNHNLCDEFNDGRVEGSNHLLLPTTELVGVDFEPTTWQAFWQTVVKSRAIADAATDFK